MVAAQARPSVTREVARKTVSLTGDDAHPLQVPALHAGLPRDGPVRRRQYRQVLDALDRKWAGEEHDCDLHGR